jgi:hypothetical protein
MRHDVLVTFRPPVAASACREDHALPLDFQVHGGITEREELMARLETRKPWFFSCCYPTEEALHGLIQTKVDLCQQLAVDVAQLWVIPFALAQGLLGPLEIPAFPLAQAHDPPIVQRPAPVLHEFQGLGVLLADFDFDLFTQ